ncbi:bacteriocin immunity protein [Acinetobacter sp. MB5]|uniref:bacteriocin immunity protein n=1 Tax=Acinetobacter sp. MB5 TaxID=2069438 RepID=UPI000DD0894A|nr:bacteriocin immunity protein [Acinetobacter sp. MB5]
MNRFNRKELINLIIRIMNAEGSDAELDADIEQLIQLSEMPDVTNLIFYPETDDVSAEDIADTIINFRPIPLE